jgi:hypothetical protein
MAGSGRSATLVSDIEHLHNPNLSSLHLPNFGVARSEKVFEEVKVLIDRMDQTGKAGLVIMAYETRAKRVEFAEYFEPLRLLEALNIKFNRQSTLLTDLDFIRPNLHLLVVNYPHRPYVNAQ